MPTRASRSADPWSSAGPSWGSRVTRPRWERTGHWGKGETEVSGRSVGKGVWAFLPRKVRRRIRSHTSDEGPDRHGERCAKGPFLLKAVAPAGCGEKVDGIPTGKSRHQARTKSRGGAVVAEHCETPRRVVGIAHTTADGDGEQKQLPCCERGCQCLVGTSKGIWAMTSHSVCAHSHPSKTGKKGSQKEGRWWEDRLSFAGALPRHGAVRQCLSPILQI